MHFCVLVSKNLKKTQNNTHFGHTVLFLFIVIVIYLCVLAFWYLRSSKTIIIHVSCNVFSLPHLGYFLCILAFIFVRISKTLKILVFHNFILFLHKGCFPCVLAVWYVCSLKTEKTTLIVMLSRFPI